jgi:hypothetical protein
LAIYPQIRDALKKLNPDEVRALSERPIKVGLAGRTPETLAAMEDVLIGPDASGARRREIGRALFRAGEPDAPNNFDLVFYAEDLPRPPEALVLSLADPRALVRDTLAARPDLELALARRFAPFRRVVIGRIIRTVAKENAVFSLVTALPDVMPSFIELPWVVGEFASDTAFLTMNQVRMAFVIAAASDREVGYRQQRAQIAGIVGSAFGWRALARELVGKIPFGGGLIPKAAVAYAGTYTVGVGLERLYRLGAGLTRKERRAIYDEAFVRGKKIVESIAAHRLSAASRRQGDGRES